MKQKNIKLNIAGIFLTILLLVPNIVFAQEKVIQGTVTAESDGLPLIGATVVETDNTKRVINASVTDVNGHYVLKIKNPNNKLAISYIGYITTSKDIGNNKTINVKLSEDTKKIEEVVVTAEKKISDGTFAIPQKEISTAVQTINTKSLEGVQVTSIDDALQGRIAGFDIVSNSGDPGSGTSMRIRGTTSINSNSQPLIVVNGIPYETEVDPSFDFATANQDQYATMLSINPDDIEEITVLKDASSTAVWGSKGANGVLVIKTKKGVTGKTRVQYSYRVTGATQPRGMSMLNGDDYTMLIKQAYFNPYQDEDAANVQEFLYDQKWSEYENFNNNTDWVKEVTQTGMKHDHYLTVMGGGERARFRVSGGYLSETGTVIGQHLQRYSTRANLDYYVSDRIKFITELSFTHSDNDKNWIKNSWDKDDPDNYSILAIAYRKMPNVSVYAQDRQGNNTDVYYNIPRSSKLHSDQRDLRNPVALANLATHNLQNNRILPTFRLQYDILDPEVKQLRYNMYVSFDVNNDKTRKYIPQEVSNDTWNDELVNYSEDWDTESMTVMMDNNITWQAINNGKHSLLLYGSAQIRTGNKSSRGFGTTNLPTGDIIEAYSDGYLNYTESAPIYSYRSNAFLVRGHYSLLNRYILGFTFRRDGSTKFGKNNKYGNFPGVSAKWIISDEPFMASTSRWLSMFAIRPSWGISGNQPWEEYLHFSRYTSYSSYIGMPASRPSTLQLSNLKWETTTSNNLGVDIGFFNNRLVFDLNFYHKRTEDLLFEDLKIASSSGYPEVSVQNVGIMDNDGWELNFFTNRVIEVGDFTMDFNFNMSNNINTIIQLRDDVLSIYNTDFDYTNGTYLSRIQEGNSFGSVYGFRYKGVYQYNEYIAGSQENAPVARDESGNVLMDEDGEPVPMFFAYGKSNAYEFKGGDAIYEDINSDGNIDELDIVYLGNSNPKFNGGFGSSLRFRGFSLTAFFNFRYGNKIVNKARMWSENMYTLDNQSKSVNWRWRKDGDLTEMPRALYNHGYNWLGSDRYVEDGSFLRLKYLTFTYSFPKEKLEKFKLNQLRFYLTINNLHTWTKYAGVDPEVGYGKLGVSADESSTPRSKDATLGITVVF
jgi:TonB-linked SusC/RagA family outer membrane protein